jgi:CheY-like chemotaxis protein
VNRMVVCSMLRTLQCAYEVVSDGDEAFRACRDATFDVVLMDCYMPGLVSAPSENSLNSVGPQALYVS